MLFAPVDAIQVVGGLTEQASCFTIMSHLCPIEERFDYHNDQESF